MSTAKCPICTDPIASFDSSPIFKAHMNSVHNPHYFPKYVHACYLPSCRYRFACENTRRVHLFTHREDSTEEGIATWTNFSHLIPQRLFLIR